MWFSKGKSIESAREEKEDKERIERQSTCEHKNFSIYGHNIIGDATCLNCGKVMGMEVFYNALTDRLRDLEIRLEHKIKNN